MPASKEPVGKKPPASLCRSAADRVSAGLKETPAGVGSPRIAQLASLVNRANREKGGIVQRYIVRNRTDPESEKLSAEQIRADSRWAQLNERQRAELLRRVGTPEKEVLDEAFIAVGNVFREHEPPAAVAPSREGASLNPEKMFASAQGSFPPGAPDERELDEPGPRAPRLVRPIAVSAETRLRHHAVTFGASHPAYRGPVRPLEFDFPPAAPKKPASPKPSTPPPSSGFKFSFGSGAAAASSQTLPSSGFTFGFGTPATGQQSTTEQPPTGFVFGTSSGTTPSTGFSFGSTTPQAPTSGGTVSSGFTFGMPSKDPPTSGGFSFGFGAPQQSDLTTASATKHEDSDSDEDEEDDPDRFVASDQRNHQVLMSNPRYAAMVASTFLQRGPINVRTDTASGAAAAWRSENNTISITSKLTGARRASAMVFEMTNAFHTPRADALKAQAEKLGENDYAIAAERIEYDGIRKHHEIMSYGVQHLGWPPQLDRYAALLAGDWSTFEGYLKKQESTGHTNMHRSNHKIMMEKLERERDRAKAAIKQQGGGASKESL